MKLKGLGFDPSLLVGAITSGELTYQVSILFFHHHHIYISLMFWFGEEEGEEREEEEEGKTRAHLVVSEKKKWEGKRRWCF